MLMTCHKAYAMLYPKTDAEFSKLPSYCTDKMKSKNKEADQAKWYKLYGKSFRHTHHYCAALNAINKSYGVSKAKKSELLGFAIMQTDYMIKHSSPKFALMGEIYFTRGNCFRRLGDVQRAVTEYMQGIQINPKFTLNYSALSKIFKKQGNITEAKKILEKGIKHIPSSKLLKKRLKNIEK